MRTGVGIVGCGQISGAYLRNASLFRDYEIKAVADRNLHKAEARGLEFGIDGCEVETLLRRADIDIILNLTPPAAHFPITMAALRAGKHVYSEKPLAATYTGRASHCQ
ncbi:Gfo/Idh/MocA family oxidoreductase [Mesorhizobium sp. AR07]|uniref:Gfo/Idh/MocA family protein n=1 Tax=Mesorhizobium sp. AR07 TaxID=2865838 RepID=UPI002160C2EA|nr:Gfo/Idh/MocA family oxidoreductase [Mesorhizobium sp. AR07]UVK43811.1 Gfo/Idh/MocA family oxidoreductase [Mesorhizobium sp. AR07]